MTPHPSEVRGELGEGLLVVVRVDPAGQHQADGNALRGVLRERPVVRRHQRLSPLEPSPHEPRKFFKRILVRLPQHALDVRVRVPPAPQVRVPPRLHALVRLVGHQREETLARGHALAHRGRLAKHEDALGHGVGERRSVASRIGRCPPARALAGRHRVRAVSRADLRARTKRRCVRPVAACLGAGRTERRGEPRDEGRRHANVAVQVPASRKGAKQSARISEPEMHPSVQQKALLWVFLTDFFWSVKKSMTKIGRSKKSMNGSMTCQFDRIKLPIKFFRLSYR